MFSNLALKNTSSQFFEFAKPISIKDLTVNEKQVNTFTSRSIRKYVNLKGMKDETLFATNAKALDEVAEEYPNHSIFLVLGNVEIFSKPKQDLTHLDMFRLSVSRNDDEGRIFITVQVKQENQYEDLPKPKTNRRSVKPPTISDDEELV